MVTKILSRELAPSAAIAEATAYKVPKHSAPIDLRLDSNTGAVPNLQILADLAQASPELVRSYPSAKNLEQILAAKFEISVEQVFATAGADDAIDRACRAMLSPEREIILPVPTFEMIEVFAKACGARITRVPWDKESYPLREVLQAISDKTAMIAVVSPNNPSGLVATIEEIKELSSAAPGALILVDYAYIEFADKDHSKELLRLPNVLITRTLSKAYGLAGLRVGYALGSKEVITWMRRTSGPYNVSSISLAYAEKVLTSGTDDMNRFIEAVRAERKQLNSLLTKYNYETMPSQGNFAYVAPSKKASWLADALAGLAIGVRRFDCGEGKSCLRITCPGNKNGFSSLSAALAVINQPEAILFDLDGVLADVSKSFREAIVLTAEKFNVQVSGEDILKRKLAGNSNNDWELTWNLIKDAGKAADLSEVTTVFENFYQGSVETPGLWKKETFLSTLTWLSSLKEKYRLAIVTGRPRKDAIRFLEENNLWSLFSAIVCMEDAPAKPSAEPVKLALKQLNCTRAWMIGDTKDDIVAARNAGVLPIAVVAPQDELSKVQNSLEAAGAARILTNLTQLEELLAYAE